MDRKTLRKWLKKQVRRITSDAAEAVDTVSAERIHEFRTGTKKLRAVLRLASEQSGQDQKLPHDFHNIYSAAGDLRNAQVALETVAGDGQVLLPVFYAWLRQRIKEASGVFRKAYHPKALKHLEEEVEGVDALIDMQTLLHFVSQHLLALHELAQPEADDTVLHEARKEAKDLQYVIAVCQKIWPEAYDLLVPLESSLVELSEKAGAYNDRRNLLNMLEEFRRDNSANTDYSETTAALQAAQDWARAKAIERQELLMMMRALWNRFGSLWLSKT
jgi:CHAD domain-containing protein